MNIQKTAPVFFGKTPVMQCVAKMANKKEKRNATLYLMNKDNESDRAEILDSNCISAIKSDVLRSAGFDNGKTYYFLMDDKTDEVISCASASRHLNQSGGKYEGLNVIVDEIGANSRYVDSMTPLLAQIAKDAYERNDNRIIVAIHRDEIPSLKRSCFSETKDDGWVLPRKRFNILLDKAEKRHSIEFVI